VSVVGVRANGTIDVEHEGRRYNVKPTKVTAVVRPPQPIVPTGQPPVVPVSKTKWDHWAEADVKVTKTVFGDVRGHFKIGDRTFSTEFGSAMYGGDHFSARHSLRSVFHFAFSDDKGSYGLTGKGNAREVMKKAVATFAKSLQLSDADAVYFTALKTASDSRASLYEFLATKSDKMFPGYKAVTKEESGKTYFMIYKEGKMPKDTLLRDVIALNSLVVNTDIDYDAGSVPIDDEVWEEIEREFDEAIAARLVSNESACGAGATGHKGFVKGNTCAVGSATSSKKAGAQVDMMSKSDIAKSSAVRVDKEIQRYAEEFNEPHFARMIGGSSLDDNEPADIVVSINGKAHGIELKTMTVGANRKLTMKKSAMDRKKAWERKNKGTMHTVVYDDTAVFNAKGPGKHDFSKRRIYYRRGYGSFRVDTMLEVTNEKALKKLMTKTASQLPKSAGGKL